MLSSIVHLYVLLFFTTKIMHGQGSDLCNPPDPDFASSINLVYYKCNNETPATITYPILPEPQKLLKVLKDIRTIFYIFGYLQFPEDENVKTMMTALCHGKTDNIVLVDWSKYSKDDYSTVFPNAEKVGSSLAKSLQLLVDEGLNVSKIYIVAHSLGTHIAGLASKCTNLEIPRITALDPANPTFYPLGRYLTKNDAKFVDVIHTDMGFYGTSFSSGTVDYYFNGGYRPQPGCLPIGLPLSKIDLCSHQRSVEVYAQSKLRSTQFTVMKCSNYFFYKINRCEGLQTGFGYTASNVNGSFYVTAKNE